MNTAGHNLLLLETALHSQRLREPQGPSPSATQSWGRPPCRAPRCAPAAPTHPLQPELVLPLHPQTGAGATSPQASRSPCSSWRAEKRGSSSSCLNQGCKSCTHRQQKPLGNTLVCVGKLNRRQINVKYTWVRSWCLSVVQSYPTHTTGTSGNWYSRAEKHGIPHPDFVWSKLEQNISHWRKIPFCRQATF